MCSNRNVWEMFEMVLNQFWHTDGGVNYRFFFIITLMRLKSLICALFVLYTLSFSLSNRNACGGCVCICMSVCVYILIESAVDYLFIFLCPFYVFGFNGNLAILGTIFTETYKYIIRVCLFSFYNMFRSKSNWHQY